MNDRIYVGLLISEPHLKHHGILGMRWGVRRFQKKDGSLTSAGKSRYGVKGSKKSKSEPETKRKGLSKGQKAAIALVAAGLAAYGGYSIYKSGALDKFISKGKNAVNHNEGAGGTANVASEKYGKIEGEHLWANDVVEVNPYHGTDNCGGCCVSLLERHNNNLNMIAKNHGQMTWDDLKEVYPDLEHKYVGPCDDSRELSSYISTHFNNGDNGILRLNSKNTSVSPNHYVVWTKAGDKVYYMDGQASGNTNKVVIYDNNPKYDILFAQYNLDVCEIAQTNNLSLTNDEAVLDKYFEKGRK